MWGSHWYLSGEAPLKKLQLDRSEIAGGSGKVLATLSTVLVMAQRAVGLAECGAL